MIKENIYVLIRIWCYECKPERFVLYKFTSVVMACHVEHVQDVACSNELSNMHKGVYMHQVPRSTM